MLLGSGVWLLIEWDVVIRRSCPTEVVTPQLPGVPVQPKLAGGNFFVPPRSVVARGSRRRRAPLWCDPSATASGGCAFDVALPAAAVKDEGKVRSVEPRRGVYMGGPRRPPE